MSFFRPGLWSKRCGHCLCSCLQCTLDIDEKKPLKNQVKREESGRHCIHIFHCFPSYLSSYLLAWEEPRIPTSDVRGSQLAFWLRILLVFPPRRVVRAEKDKVKVQFFFAVNSTTRPVNQWGANQIRANLPQFHPCAKWAWSPKFLKNLSTKNSPLNFQLFIQYICIIDISYISESLLFFLYLWSFEWFSRELFSNLHQAATQPLFAEFMSKLAVLEGKVRQGEPFWAREHKASNFW